MADDFLTQGIAAVKAGNIHQARQLLDSAIKQNPNDERTWGWFYNVCENDEERLHCLKEILRIVPNNEKAKQKYNELTGLGFQHSPDLINTKSTPTHLSTNDIISLQVLKCPMCGANVKQYDRECKYCGSTLIIVSLEKTFSTQIDNQILSASTSKWKEVLNKDPNNPEANYALGLAYLNQKLRDAALQYLQKASLLGPESPFIHYNLALTLLDDGNVKLDSEDYSNGIKEIGYSLLLDPNFREAKAFKHFFIARKLDSVNYTEAIKEYQAAIQECPDIALMHNNLGLVYYRSKQFSNARNCYLRALEINPEYYITLSNLCLLSYATGNYKEGVQYGKKAIELIRPTISDDSQAFGYNNLALCLSKLGQKDEAIQMVERAIAIKPTQPLFRKNLAAIKNRLTKNQVIMVIIIIVSLCIFISILTFSSR
jgi:tetratricopeptide (TPR) repeat protein